MSSDRQLLIQYTQKGYEQAFKELVNRYFRLVHSTALRKTNNHELAKEVTQNTFVLLARKANSLEKHPSLGGWLIKTTVYMTRKSLRTEQRRNQKLKEYVEMAQTTTEEPSIWKKLSPYLDDALTKLSSGDREAVLLRYYHNKKFKEIGKILGKSEEASRKQIKRSLKKLSLILRRKGVTVSITTLGTSLLSNFPGKAMDRPSELISNITTEALLAQTTISTTTILNNTIHIMASSTHVKTAAAVSLLACIPIGIQWKEKYDLQKTITYLEQSSNEPLKGSPTQRNHSKLKKSNFKNKLRRLVKLDLQLKKMKEGSAEFMRTYGNLLKIAHSMSTEEIELALQETNTVDLEAMLAGIWAEKDGLSAMGFVLNKPARLQGRCLEQWAASDPHAAYDWYQSNNNMLKIEPLVKQRFEALVIAGIAKTNFDLALLNAKSAAKAYRSQILQKLAPIAASKPEQLKKFISYLHTLDDNSRVDASGALSSHLVKKDLSSAIQFAENWPGKDTWRITDPILVAWGKTEPSKAILWRLKFPGMIDDPIHEGTGVRQVLREWVRRAPKEVEAWVNSQDKLNKDELRELVLQYKNN